MKKCFSGDILRDDIKYYELENVMMKSKTVIPQSMTKLAPSKVFPVCHPGQWRNGVVVRMPNHLGDAIMALPALAALKSAMPENCGLFVVAPANCMQLYQSLPCVDDIVPLARPHKFWSKDEKKQVRQLHAGAALLFNHSFRDALCFKLAGVPELYGEPTRNRGFLLKGKFAFEKKRRGEYSKSHQAMRYMALAEALGGKRLPGFMPELVIPCPADEIVGPAPALFHHPMVLTLAPGAAYGAAKRWPHEYYTKVAAWWIRRGGVVALCGSGGESGICEAIQKELPENRAFNLCGQTDLFALMYLFRFSKFVVANDSGLMHLASAVKAPGLTVFGPTDLYDTGPVADDWLMLHDREKCAPCLRRVCPKGDPVCTKKITPFMVIRAINRKLFCK